MALTYRTAGESHGPALTTIIEGLPAGLPLTPDDIDADLARRQLGYGRGGRQKIETDRVQVTAGMLAQDDGRSWIPVAVLMWVGVLAGDSIIFLLGCRFGAKLLAWQGTHHLFPPAKQAKVQALFGC